MEQQGAPNKRPPRQPPPPPISRNQNAAASRTTSKKRTSRANRSSRPKHKRGVPQPQQVKVAFRSLQDLTHLASVEQILEMVRTIVVRVNEENKQKQMFVPIQLDEGSFQRLVEQEQMVQAAAAKAKAAEESEGQQGEEIVVEMDGNVPMTVDKDDSEETNTKVETEQSDNAAPKKFASVVKGQQQQGAVLMGNGPVVGARALYVVPPKKSRRRGIKSGCAYLVLTGPTVAEKEEDYAAMTSLQQSRAMAKVRLQLLTAVEALEQHGEEDANSSNPQYGGCIIQQSASGKAWKQSYRDNREGTVETTADYKRFVAKEEQQEEERMARPRPTPGGATTSATNDANGSESGEQIAAIVLHLQAKRKQEARRRKAATKKSASAEPKGSKKGAASSKDGSSKNAGRSGGAKKERNRRGGGRKKDTSNGSSTKPQAQPPVVMNASNFPVL